MKEPGRVVVDDVLGALSRDRSRHGELDLLQPLRGYRFNFDALLLADFAIRHLRRPRGRAPLVCDIGAGCGIVGLMVLRAVEGAHLTAIELQPRLAAIVRRNLDGNGLAERGEVLELDVTSPAAKRRLPGGRFDWVVTNPPYQAVGRGHSNPDGELAIARHEVRLPLGRLCDEMRRVLRPKGQAAIVYPAARLGELCTAAASVGLQPTRLRAVHARASDPATRVLLLCEKGGAPGALKIVPPLVEYDERGVATEQVRQIAG